jgi:Xaa-Pro aminopeptidase
MEVKGAMVGACLSSGAARMAYPPIVGSGPNAVTLHYERDDRRMEAGEMLVNDTACEYGMFAADITRSYPVAGRFTAEQRAIYELVLAAQKAGIAKVRPGAAFHEAWDATVDVVIDGLMKLGVLKGTREEIVKSKSWQAFYPHGCSHWLGLDVHDAGSYGMLTVPGDRLAKFSNASAKLVAGEALTMEPGIYIPKGTKDVDPKWWGIGVRIEDDILVTEGGNECLSCGLPREVAELEKALAP